MLGLRGEGHMGKRRLVTAFAVAAALMLPGGALAFGPAPPPGNPDGTAQLDACGNALDRQLAKDVTAGGGPKAGEPGPLNCDHFFQGNDSGVGNGWPPPPFQP
jgi:hypothetical protein